MVFSFSQDHNSSNGFLDQTWRVYKSKTLTCISKKKTLHIFFYNLGISLNIFLNFFFFFFLCQNLSEFSGFQTLFFHRKQKCAISFHSLLPLPKRIRQGLTAWILFVSLLSIFQKNKGPIAWIILCLPSPFSKNSKWHSLKILLILPFPINKRFQRTNRLRYLLFPLHKVSKD